MEISIIIGLFNECDIVRRKIEQLHQVLNKNYENFEIILVNDGSTDFTEREIQELKKQFKQIKIVSYKNNKGKGYAIKEGVKVAQGKYVLYTDIDLAYAPEQILLFVKRMNETNADGVIGSRLLQESVYLVTSETFKTIYIRHLISQVFNGLSRFFFKLNTADTQCGVKCFKKEILSALTAKQRINTFSFDVELLLIAKINKLILQQIPVSVEHSSRNSKVRIFKHSIFMLWDLLKIKYYQLHGAYLFNEKI